MKQVTKWIAEDGTSFDTEWECVAYEEGEELQRTLYNFITHNIGLTFNDDAGFSIIKEGDVLRFIMDYLPEITASVNRIKS